MAQYDYGKPVLAIYDFRSKQEFIYRTNKVREISGASELIAGMYGELLSLELPQGHIRNDWRNPEAKPVFDDGNLPLFAEGETGIVVYEGGGNLCVLFKSREEYNTANRVFSRHVIERGYSLCLVTGSVDWDESLSFDENRTRMYRRFDANKRIGDVGIPCNVLPYTQVDRTTYQPIDEQDMGVLCADYPEWKELWLHSKHVGEQLTRESKMKLAVFFRKARKDGQWFNQGKHIDQIGSGRGDSLIAVVYFDGNSIGDLLKERGGSVEGMRRFSKEIHKALVEDTEKAMRKAISAMPDERHRDYRIIIDHGDEITLVCNAHAAPLAIDAYFKALEESGYHACAGMAICHSHDPFSEVYKIAEACCESGKKANRSRLKSCSTREARMAMDASFVDFHFCRSGITGNLEQIRESQEAGMHARPYRATGFDADYAVFLEAGARLARSGITRGDIKELNRAMLRGKSWYLLECERLKAKDGAMAEVLSMGPNPEQMAKILFDVSGFWDVFDVRFGVGSKEDEHGDD